MKWIIRRHVSLLRSLSFPEYALHLWLLELYTFGSSTRRNIPSMILFASVLYLQLTNNLIAAGPIDLHAFNISVIINVVRVVCDVAIRLFLVLNAWSSLLWFEFAILPVPSLFVPPLVEVYRLARSNLLSLDLANMLLIFIDCLGLRVLGYDYVEHGVVLVNDLDWIANPRATFIAASQPRIHAISCFLELEFEMRCRLLASLGAPAIVLGIGNSHLVVARVGLLLVWLANV